MEESVSFAISLATPLVVSSSTNGGREADVSAGCSRGVMSVSSLSMLRFPAAFCPGLLKALFFSLFFENLLSYFGVEEGLLEVRVIEAIALFVLY